jgi:hypothetical protein
MAEAKGAKQDMLRQLHETTEKEIALGRVQVELAWTKAAKQKEMEEKDAILQ